MIVDFDMSDLSFKPDRLAEATLLLAGQGHVLL